jgi:hypothetical protein
VESFIGEDDWLLIRATPLADRASCPDAELLEGGCAAATNGG